MAGLAKPTLRRERPILGLSGPDEGQLERAVLAMPAAYRVPFPCRDRTLVSHLFAPARIRYVRAMFYKLPLADSLEHVASADELIEYRQVQRGGLLAGLPGSCVFGATVLTGLNRGPASI
jgi:hypothetical protein